LGGLREHHSCSSRIHPFSFFNRRECDTLPALWRFILAEAAKQCVFSKLTTHWGGPKETLLALEQSLKQLAGHRHSGEDGAQIPASVQYQGICLLHFIFFLEQEVSNAMTGSSARAGTSKSAAVYCFSNAEACHEWFSRLHPCMVSCASLLRMHHHVVYFGWLCLDALRNKQAAVSKLKTLHEKRQIVRIRGDNAASDPVVGSTRRRSGRNAEEDPFDYSSLSKQKKVLLKKPSATPTVDGISKNEMVRNPAAALLNGAPGGSEGGGGETWSRGGSSNPAEVHNTMAWVAEQMARALKTLHDANSIEAICALCRGTVDEKGREKDDAGSVFGAGEHVRPDYFDLLDVAKLQASGMHEQALERLQNLFPFVIEDDGQDWGQLQVESYVALNDWEGLQAWLKVRISLSEYKILCALHALRPP